MLNTARRNIQCPNPNRADRPDIPAHLGYLAAALDVDVIYAQGTHAARLAAAHQPSGGKFWWETDTLSMWYDDGAAWHSVGPENLTGTIGAIPGAVTVAAGTLYFATDNGVVYRSDGVVWTVVASPSGQILGYQEFVANVTGVQPGTGATYNVVTAPVINFDGAPVNIEFFCPWAYIPPTMTGAIELYDVTGAAAVCDLTKMYATPNIALNAPIVVKRKLTPVAGNRQYRVRITQPNASDNFTLLAGDGAAGHYVPGYIKITRDQ